MWKDVTEQITLEKTWLSWKNKLNYECQVIGEMGYGYISVCVSGYRVRIEKGVDSEGYFTRFFIEKDFEAYELQENAIKNATVNSQPFVLVREMKFLDVTHHERELFINVEAICVIERLVANRCKVSLKTGQVLELEYDATRIRKKLEELEPESVLRV